MMTMPFGKYKGRALDEVPSGYLDWLITKATGLRPEQRESVEAELGRRRQVTPSLGGGGRLQSALQTEMVGVTLQTTGPAEPTEDRSWRSFDLDSGGDMDICRLIVDAGSNVLLNAIENRGREALYWAVVSETDVDAIKVDDLLEAFTWLGDRITSRATYDQECLDEWDREHRYVEAAS